MANIYSNLLNAEERLDLYAPPALNALERTEYFTFNKAEIEALRSFKNTANAVYFCISLVFFKLKNTLVNFTFQDVTQERQHVMQRYFPTRRSPRSLSVAKKTIVQIENKILQLCGHTRYSGAIKVTIEKELQVQANRCPRQRQLCKLALNLFKKHNCAIPSYSTIQSLISTAWNIENQRIIQSCNRNTSSSQRVTILRLLEKTDKLHRIISIKKDMKSFTHDDLLTEIKKHDQLKPIFEAAIDIIPKLKLPATTIQYYANMINYYNGPRLKEIDKNKVLLYLICYCSSRYEAINDNLFEALKKRTFDYDATLAESAKIQVGQAIADIQEPREQASQLLTAVHAYQRKLIPKSEIFKYIPESKLLDVAQLLINDKLDKNFHYWKNVDALEGSIKINLRKIFVTIDFVVVNDALLKKVVDFMKETLSENKVLHFDTLPSYIKQWIGNKTLRFIIPNNILLSNRLEFLFYKRIVHHMSTNKFTLKHTIQHKPLEDDLYENRYWRKNKSKILNNIDHPEIKVPIKTLLKTLRDETNALYSLVNEEILNGRNKAIKLKLDKNGNNVWRLRPLTVNTDPNEMFFPELPKRSIVDVIRFVDEKTNFIRSFESVLPKSQKTDMDKFLIMASVLANAIRLGTNKMADTSDLNRASLLTTEASYLRTETIHAAIDKINNEASKLPIFKQWYINSLYHGSLDGLKLEVNLDNIAARYSKKFFGKESGVSGYNAILNYFSITGKLIGANQYEGNYTFEMVEHQNTSELQFDHVSTDKHGMNVINYLLFFMTGREFAPRIPKPHREILWGFDSLKNYEEFLVKPTRLIDENLIITEWDNIQRLIASLITGETPPHVIIRKLSSKNYSSNTKKAFLQLNNLLKSRFILKYIHDEEFRRAILMALNRGESYNNLYRSITILRKGAFKGKSEIEMEIWNQCTRLISSVMLYFNSHLLNSLYENASDEVERRFVLGLSPSAWVHINLLGFYKFCGKNHCDIEQWISEMDWRKIAGFC